MTFNETMLAVEASEQEFENIFIRCSAFLEASYNEYKTNLKESELKVIEEAGNNDDKAHLDGKASEGLIGRGSRVIKKLIKAFVEWVKNICDKIRGFFNDAKTKSSLKKAEKALKSNPKLKNKKVEITDFDKVKDVHDKHESMVDRKIALFKAGKFSEKDVEELDNIVDSHRRQRKAALGATITVAVGTLIGSAFAYKHYMEKKEKTDVKEPEIKDDTTPAAVEAMLEATRAKISICKDRLNDATKAIKSVFGKAISLFTKEGEVETDLNKDTSDTKQESVEDDNEIIDETIDEVEETVQLESSIDEEEYLESLLQEMTESVEEDDVESLFSESSEDVEEDVLTLESIEEELLNESEDETEVTESTEDTNGLEAYLETMEQELFNDNDDEFNEYMESLEDELFESYDDEIEVEEGSKSDVAGAVAGTVATAAMLAGMVWVMVKAAEANMKVQQERHKKLKEVEAILSENDDFVSPSEMIVDRYATEQSLYELFGRTVVVYTYNNKEIFSYIDPNSMQSNGEKIAKRHNKFGFKMIDSKLKKYEEFYLAYVTLKYSLEAPKAVQWMDNFLKDHEKQMEKEAAEEAKKSLKNKIKSKFKKTVKESYEDELDDDLDALLESLNQDLYDEVSDDDIELVNESIINDILRDIE